MSHKKHRFKITKSPKSVEFRFPGHLALMAISKNKNLFSLEEPTGVSVFVGDEESYRINWKMRSSLTTDNRVEFSLYDSKERKQVTVYLNLIELLRSLILDREIILEEEDYRMWE